jgi:hypothetical protein
MPPILDPDTPGGFRASMDWSRLSSSATADDIVDGLTMSREEDEKGRKEDPKEFKASRINTDPRLTARERSQPGIFSLLAWQEDIGV